ncbi:MAG: hypothetical protein HON90_03945 [Halobacteriovoraceae bacterium]|jgi:hypothetical protein|nr:hypothetical protein [Halobacteriovoraceae bacterium]
MSETKIKFIPSSSNNELNEIYNFNTIAFADSQDFAWSKENIKKEIKSGWEVISVKIENDIICALFLKEEQDCLLTKNTPIKLNYQGQGLSHIIKDYYEDYAKSKSLTGVLNYCPADNFRMIALNESHGYTKTGRNLDGNNSMIEWEKNL